MKSQNFEVLSTSNIEDIIRKPIDNNTNILSGIFENKNL